MALEDNQDPSIKGRTIMAQAGIHGLAGMAVRKLAPRKEWLMFGIVLGNILPDMENLTVAIATITGRPTEGLHRTFTHSLFFVAAIFLMGYLSARALGDSRLGNLGMGLGVGVLMHIGLDLLVWFNGVEILWPIPSWVNLWEGVSVPGWLSKLLMPAEFLFLGLFLWVIIARARQIGGDADQIRLARFGVVVMMVLFVVFTVLVYTMELGFMVPYGGAYLACLGLVIVVVVRMRDSVDYPG
jgi:membrane-bound metal-dependent hydrolase YbcI (DUF457 family)